MHFSQQLATSHLELLVALHQASTLAEAASQVGISPSAASHRLREAERRAGVELTEPIGRHIRLTSAGRHLAEAAQTAAAQLAAAHETARWMAAAARPAVRIGLDFYDTAPWFETLIAQPELPCDLDFIRVPYGGIAANVASRHIDLGVNLRPSSATQPHEEQLADDLLVAVVPPGHPAATRGVFVPEDIVGHTYATAGDRPEPGFEHHEFFERAGVRPQRIRKVESLAMILRLMRKTGTGATVQPWLAVAAAPLDPLRVVPLAEVTIPVNWVVVRQPPQRENELVTPLLGHLRAYLERLPPPPARPTS